MCAVTQECLQVYHGLVTNIKCEAVKFNSFFFVDLRGVILTRVSKVWTGPASERFGSISARTGL